jgi:uncharacterized Zn finger protein
MIRRHATSQSFERGQHYYRTEAVSSLIQRGDVLSAQVEGTEAVPYQIRICFDSSGIKTASCSCLYDYEGWCKHIVATLLICLYQSNQIEQRPELAKQLASLTREQLQTIVQNLAQAHPDWTDAIESQIIQLVSPNQKASKSTRRTAIAPKPIEQQVERIIDRSAGQWTDTPALDEIREILQKADAFLDQGDGNNALIILGAIARAYMQDWMNLDGSSGESGDFFEELNDALTEAILSAELSASDRKKWQAEIEAWRSEVDDYGISEGFAMSLTALAQGWDYLPLKRVLQGEITNLGAWEDEAPHFADDLALIRLRILERQERYQEYLYFAEAESQTDRYLQMLAKLGRTEEAVSQAQQQMGTPGEAWTLAQALREQGEFEQALQIAMQGLRLEGDGKYQLAVWTSELAEGIDHSAALQTRYAAFKIHPALSDYLKLQELSGEHWESL